MWVSPLVIHPEVLGMSSMANISSFQSHQLATAGVLVILTLILGACGGGDDQPEPQQASGTSLVPANLDTLIAETGSGRPENQNPQEGSPEAETPAAPAETPVVTELEPEIRPEGSNEDGEEPSPTQVREIQNEISTPVPGGLYSVQLGSFRKVDNALQLAGKISDAGYPATVEEALVHGETYHRVFVRGLGSGAEAENLGEELSRQLGISYLVLRAK
jgi:cell division septation protein DedD